MADEAKTSSSRSIEKLSKILDSYFDEQAKSYRRVNRLVDVARRIGTPATLLVLGGRDPSDVDASQDILRAAVVLTHAHLEEFLRTIARLLLPVADENCLNEVPLAGLGGRKEKFLLGKLVQHKGKLVDDLLKESVAEYLERSNYNSAGEIADLLHTLGFNLPEHREHLPEIQQMIERRHQIVHRGDRFEDADSVTTLQPIDPSDVSRWLGAIHLFQMSLSKPLTRKLMLHPEFRTPKDEPK
jgi:RiboL-PSP-HEPN